MSTRREILRTAASAGLLALAGCSPRGPDKDYYVSGSILGGWKNRGHLLRNQPTALPEPKRIQRCETVVLGAGVSGLSAAYALEKAGHRDFIVCEVGDSPGGNALSGASVVSRYPWGAHYVPVIDPEDEPLRDFFTQAGVIRDIGSDGLPIYEESMLCSDPDERLCVHGFWQEGFMPTIGASKTDLAESERFLATVAALRNVRGDDGLAAFALPIERSSADRRWRDLDQLAFSDYLAQQGYRSPTLHWYLNYCCRDDFGAPATAVSAWAGLHYFASRRGRAANAGHGDVVTWPEGNAFLVNALAATCGSRLQTAALVHTVSVKSGLAQVDFLNRNGEPERIIGTAAILALPHHVLKHLGPDVGISAESTRHTPWAVANITLTRRPEGRGAALAWDNVVFDSPLLGYVVADHQNLGRPRDSLVVTYYWPLTHLVEQEARRFAERRSHADWCADFLSELYRIHPELRGHVDNLDLWIWGHGMTCPEPGFIWGAERTRRTAARPPLFFCHTDISGMSVFEEAFSLGHNAAAERLRLRL